MERHDSGVKRNTLAAPPNDLPRLDRGDGRDSKHKGPFSNYVITKTGFFDTPSPLIITSSSEPNPPPPPPLDMTSSREIIYSILINKNFHPSNAGPALINIKITLIRYCFDQNRNHNQWPWILAQRTRSLVQAV